MSPRIAPPKIDLRKADDLLKALREMAPHYTKEWPAKDDDDPGVALLKIFSFIGEGVIGRLNRAPDRNLLAFLDMLGIRLLQARAAHVPVRFVVANGTEIPFLVPVATQVSAPPTEEHPIDLPYETTSNLFVVPSELTSLIAVDPELDKIYTPPPGFLTLELAAAELPPLIVQAFSSAQSKSLQLDPPDQVKKGDFLRIDQLVTQSSGPDQCIPIVEVSAQQQSEHLVVADVKGSVVQLTDPLTRDYGEGTRVRKVTRFELFEGKNWQEHNLYLAHSEYFAIKSEAKITLEVKHAPGADSNLQSFDVVWEFFGVTDADKTEGWHQFQLDADGTQGLTRDGQILLTKPAGEIKETEIDGNKSRWIRGRLNGPLSAIPTPILPKIDSISLSVSSGGKIPPDQAFHNDTPLTTDVKFFPFGTEPRIFDRFSLASEEAFSKPNAQVTLDFELDATDLLAAPAPVVNAGRLRVFAHAAAGKLVEFQVDPLTSATPAVKKHETPPGTRIVTGSIPAVVTHTTAGNRVGIFVKADDGKIYLRFLLGDVEAGFQWIDLQAPPGTLQFDLTAVRLTNLWIVFAVSNNQLFSKVIDALSPNTSPSAWTPHIGGTLPQINSTPFVLDVGGRTAVFVTDVDGKTFKWDFVWSDLTPQVTLPTPGPDSAYLGATNARPFVIPNATNTNFRIYLRSRNNDLVKIDTSDPTRNQNYGPPPNTPVDSNPTAAVSGTSDVSVYVRGKDNRLWSIVDSASFAWRPHLSPSELNLASDPSASVFQSGQGDFVSVFSTSDKNSLLEFRLRGDAVTTGTFRAAPEDILVLEHSPSTSGEYFIHITDGPGKDSTGDTVRHRDNSLSRGSFTVVDQAFNGPTTTDTTYNLLRGVDSGDVVSATATTVELQAGAGANIHDGDYVLIDENQIRRIPTAPAAGDVVTIDRPWTTVPTTADSYIILRPQANAQDDHATANSARLAVLESGASNNDHEYRDLFLEITSGPGQSPTGLLIEDYIGATRCVVMDQEFQPIPDKTSDYRINVTSLSQGWFAYQVPDQTELRPELSWEYWNGRGFVALKVDDKTKNFLIGGTVRFTLPEDIAKTEVAGQENFWIRARIVGGDYGRELFTVDPITNKITVEKDPIRPPLVKNISIIYSVTELKAPQFCLTLNNLNYLDQTAANITVDKTFYPFLPLEDKGKSLYLGFDRSLRGGPIKLYFAANELAIDERNKPKLVWSFASDNDWKEMLAEDATEAFTRPDFVSLNIPDGFQNTLQFGRALYWMRGSLTEGIWPKSPLFSGVFLNSVETIQARSIRDEILGSSTGVKNQKFKFQQVPVIEGQVVRVREALTEQEREQLVEEFGPEVVQAISDNDGRVITTWVKWSEVLEFFDSNSGSRHYRLDRHTGDVEFGDGIRGRIPPAGGDNIVAFNYQAGGGAAGNVTAGEINTLVTAVAGADSVINPVPAGGGSDAATNDDMMIIGPAQISHRERAVTPDDFERLALEASREVRKARCLPNRNADGRFETGWTTVYIVPDSDDAEPVPSLELRRSVQRYLSDRADLTVVDQEHITIGPPKYVPVTVEVTVFAKSLDLVAVAEQRVKQELELFLHPLKGGPDNEGWEFGRDLASSDLYALIESIEEVDHVGPLTLFLGETSKAEQVAVNPDALIASGPHRITMSVSAGE